MKGEGKITQRRGRKLAMLEMIGYAGVCWALLKKADQISRLNCIIDQSYMEMTE